MTIPFPNCGHRSTTYTHDVFRDLWMCMRCVCSLLGFSTPRCSSCGTAQSSLQTSVCRACVDKMRDSRR